MLVIIFSSSLYGFFKVIYQFKMFQQRHCYGLVKVQLRHRYTVVDSPERVP